MDSLKAVGSVGQDSFDLFPDILSDGGGSAVSLDSIEFVFFCRASNTRLKPGLIFDEVVVHTTAR